MSVILMILGWILKIIGILLGLVLLLILIVLITPIRYEVEAAKSPELTYGAKITWLLKALQFHISQSKLQRIREIRVFGFRVSSQTDDISPDEDETLKDLEEDLWESDWEEMEEEEFKRKLFRYLYEEDNSKEGDIISNRKAVTETIEIKESSQWDSKEKHEEPIERNLLESSLDEEFTEESVSTTSDNNETPTTSKIEKIRAKVDFAWEIFQWVREYFRKNKGLIKHILYWIFRVVKSILPRKIDGNVHFGLSDPSHTGYVLGIFYLFYPSKHVKIEIKPNFDTFIIEGKLKIKGRILFIEMIYYLLRLVIDIRIIRLGLLLMKILKKIKNNNTENIDTQESGGKNGR